MIWSHARTILVSALKHKKVYEIPLVFPEEHLISEWTVTVKDGMLRIVGKEEKANPPTSPDTPNLSSRGQVCGLPFSSISTKIKCETNV
jgi:hypothetical protein